MAGIIGWKLEMTRIIKESAFIPVTLVKVPALKIVQIKTIENDGYSAVVLGASVGKRTILRELPATGKFSEMKLGDDVTLDILEGILTVSVR